MMLKMHVKSPQELQLHSYLATIPFQLTKTMIINFLEVKSRLDEQGLCVENSRLPSIVIRKSS